MGLDLSTFYVKAQAAAAPTFLTTALVICIACSIMQDFELRTFAPYLIILGIAYLFKS